MLLLKSMNLWVLDAGWDLGRCHTSTMNLSPPSASQSQAGPSKSVQLESVLFPKSSDGAFILPFCLWLALLISSTLLFCQERCLSPPSPCFPIEFSGHCSAALAQRNISFELAHPALSVSIPLGQLIRFVSTTSYPLCLLSLTFPIQKLSLTQVEKSDLFLWIGFVYSYLSFSYM